MSSLRTAVAIIPVRLGSQRLPGKALLADTGLPLFVHTCRAAQAAGCFARVIAATDDDRIAEAATAADIEVVRTSEHPRTGSERCAEALPQLDLQDADVVVDVQGDWPEIEPGDLARLAASFDDPAIECATLASTLTDPEQVADPNVVKVVRGLGGDALYFSRATIPYGRGEPSVAHLRHVGIYAFRARTLRRIPDLPSSGLAETESLEQLRFLENGIAIRVLLAHGDPRGIEARADYDRFVERQRSLAPRPEPDRAGPTGSP